jgi:hypothetical protein
LWPLHSDFVSQKEATRQPHSHRGMFRLDNDEDSKVSATAKVIDWNGAKLHMHKDSILFDGDSRVADFTRKAKE